MARDTQSYRGCSIYRNRAPFGRNVLRWTAYAGDRFVQADTLAGIKRMIHETLD